MPANAGGVWHTPPPWAWLQAHKIAREIHADTTAVEMTLTRDAAADLAAFLRQFAEDGSHITDMLYEALAAWLSPDDGAEERATLTQS